MKKLTYLLSTLLLFFVGFSSCTKKIITEPGNTVLVLKHQLTSGSNGMSVAYNPKTKLYYAVIGGNTSFPLEVFDEKGNRIAGSKAGVDVRGLWWNAKTKQLEANAYQSSPSKVSVAGIKLNDDNQPTGDIVSITNDEIQPNINSSGAFNYKTNEIVFYNEGKLYKVKRNNFENAGSVKLSLPVDKDYINTTTVIYTGVKKKDVGVLDFKNNKVYLFNSKTGEHTQSISLPSSVRSPESFRFSYANGYIWFYNKGTRAWTGYKIIK